MKNRLFLSAPNMGGNELQHIKEVFASNYIAPLGAYVDKFEDDIKSYTKSLNALAVSSGTAAIHLALRVIGVGRGDDVIASTFTFIGSITAILYQGACPILIDSESESWNLSPKLLEEYLSSCEKIPKALVLTHLYGQSADVEKICEICKKFGVILIEDAAESLGATYQGQHTGTFGDFGVYSFNGNKILTTSGGGMLVAKNKEHIERALYYSTQARENELYYEHTEYGYNYRMSNVLAAIGVGQMEVIEERVSQKRAIFDAYKDRLSAVSELSFMPELNDCRGNRWLTTLILEETDPLDVITALEKVNAESRPLWKPMHLQPVFKEHVAIVDGTSESLYKKGICLPSSTSMDESDVERVCKVIVDICT